MATIYQMPGNVSVVMLGPSAPALDVDERRIVVPGPSLSDDVPEPPSQVPPDGTLSDRSWGLGYPPSVGSAPRPRPASEPRDRTRLRREGAVQRSTADLL